MNKIPTATGGSRGDGFIEMSYEYGGFEKPVVLWGQALITASTRCQAWGYKSAEAFGGVLSTCLERNQYGCMRYFVTKKYQCLGKDIN